jgi:hypothetical protein
MEESVLSTPTFNVDKLQVFVMTWNGNGEASAVLLMLAQVVDSRMVFIHANGSIAAYPGDVVFHRIKFGFSVIAR